MLVRQRLSLAEHPDILPSVSDCSWRDSGDQGAGVPQTSECPLTAQRVSAGVLDPARIQVLLCSTNDRKGCSSLISVKMPVGDVNKFGMTRLDYKFSIFNDQPIFEQVSCEALKGCRLAERY